MGGDEAGSAKQILRWAEQKMPEFYWGEGQQTGSFFPGLTVAGVWSGMVALWTEGNIELQFQHISRRDPFNDDALLRELFDRVCAIDGVELPLDRIKKRPGFPIEVLASEGRMNQFMEVLEWFLARFLETKAEGAEG